MSTSAQLGQLAFAIQSGGKYAIASGGGAGDGELLSTINAWPWKYHRLISADISPQQFVDSLPQEVGGGLFVDTSFKTGAFVSGGFAINTRLQDSIGTLLYGASGSYATATGGNTTFSVNSSDDSSLPWVAFKRYLPGDTSSNGQTEYFLNTRITTMGITIPQQGPMRTEFTVVGQKPLWADSLGSKMAATYEGGTSLGMSCESTITLSGMSNSQLPNGGAFTGAQIIIANNFTTPQQEMIIGSNYPDDFASLARGCIVRLVYKWKDPSLYRAIFAKTTGVGSSSEARRYWTDSMIFSPITIVSQSANDITGHAGEKYQLTFTAPNVAWTMEPPTLAAQQMLQCQLTGVVHQASSGTPSWQATLHNWATYNW